MISYLLLLVLSYRLFIMAQDSCSLLRINVNLGPQLPDITEVEELASSHSRAISSSYFLALRALDELFP